MYVSNVHKTFKTKAFNVKQSVQKKQTPREKKLSFHPLWMVGWMKEIVSNTHPLIVYGSYLTVTCAFNFKLNILIFFLFGFAMWFVANIPEICHTF